MAGVRAVRVETAAVVHHFEHHAAVLAAQVSFTRTYGGAADDFGHTAVATGDGYLLAGYHKRDALSTEGAIKYFLLGSFSSAIMPSTMLCTYSALSCRKTSRYASMSSDTGGSAPL